MKLSFYMNMTREKNQSSYNSPEFFDAQLAPLGWKQVDNLRKHVHASELSNKIELVVVSPLLRTMQTAAGVFGGEGCVDGIDEPPPLMVENEGDSIRPAISSLKSPPFVAMELCRERLGVNWCDRRRSIRDYKLLFPIESDDDVLWKVEVREADKELAARGLQFLNWLWTRKGKEIAVVTHSAFLIQTLNEFGSDCDLSVKSEICRPFTNCELRSVVIVDRRTTDFLEIILLEDRFYDG